MTSTQTRPAIGCTRISTDGQRDGYGQAVQADEIRKEAHRLGLQLQTIIEEVESGAKSDREMVQQYYRLAEVTPGLNFIFPRVDRIGRRARLILEIVEELHKRNAIVHVIGVAGDLRTPAAWMMLTVMAGMAEYDHRNIRTNMILGKLRKAKAGLWPSGNPPYAYRVLRDEKGNSTHLEVIPDQAGIVRQIFELAQHQGSVSIAATLNKQGTPPPRPERSKGWTPAIIKYILRNPAYRGMWVYGGENAISIPVPAIVTEQQWQTAQAAMTERARIKPYRTPDPQLLTGHVRCADCSYSMFTLKSRSGQKHYRYYHCKYSELRHARAALLPQCTNRKFHRTEHLEEQAWQFLVEVVTSPERLHQLLNREHQTQTVDVGRVEFLQDKIKEAYAWVLKGKISEEAADEITEEYRQELHALKNHVPKATPSVDTVRLSRELGPAVLGAESFEDKRAFLRAFRVVFFVNKNGVQRITLDVPTP